MNTESTDRTSQLQRLLRELESLADAGLPEQQFQPEFLKRVVELVAAPVGVVWRLANGQFDMAAGFGIDAAQASKLSEATPHLRPLLAEATGAGEVRYATPDASAPAPFDRTTTILAPIVVDESTSGIVQVFYPGEVEADRRSGISRMLETVAGYASRALANGRSGPAISTEATQADFDRFAVDVHRSLVPKEVAATAANDGRLLVGCDRLSIVLARGRSIRTFATSGVDRVDRRANSVRRMEALCRVVMATGEPLRYSGSVADLAPQVEEPLADFLEECGSRGIEIIPLVATRPVHRTTSGTAEEPSEKQEQKVLGCLVAEWTGERPRSLAQLDRVADHVAPALQNAVAHDQIFLQPAFRTVGRGFEWFRGRRVWAAVAILAGIALLITALCVVPWDYRVEGRGRLMPIVRREVFAPENAHVDEIVVESGQPVEAGDELVRLRSDELDERRLQLVTEFNERSRQITALRGRIVEARDDSEAIARFEAELAETIVRVAGIRKQIDTLDERLKTLVVRAPIAGTVATFQLRQRLEDRPVQRGESLLELMQPEQGWRLELEVDEKRIGHLTSAQAESEGEPLEVEYVLATAPESSYHGRLGKLAERVRTNEEGGSVLEVHVALDENERPVQRFGSEVRARIDCGERSLGYVLFGDVVEFVRRRLWW